uniref:Retrovirus-related Pol polyprotein from transposon TNT 1-94 n=1 Tax=Tanacetum cinerariifolium TaxID=118510 RepID=A0A6L2K2Q6_TANCI|nr:retrovirus-related Pol polyprotein from transposon TNT 1-94 [Tanacetum cinerariifolium]
MEPASFTKPQKVLSGYGTKGYSFVSKAFRVFNTRRKQAEETFHVTFDESMEAIRFTNTSIDDIRIDDSSRYPPDEFFLEDDPSRQYQANSNISYYITPHNCLLAKLTQTTDVPEGGLDQKFVKPLSLKIPILSGGIEWD